MKILPPAGTFYFDRPLNVPLHKAWRLLALFTWYQLHALLFAGDENNGRFLACLAAIFVAELSEDKDKTATIVIIGTLLSGFASFGMVYIYVWSRIHPTTLLGIGVKTIIGAVVTLIFSERESDFPGTSKQVTKEWLEENLSKRGHLPASTTITSLKLLPLGGNGFIGDTVKAVIVKNDGAAESLVIKTSPNGNLPLKAKMRLGAFVYSRETSFYAYVQPRMQQKEGEGKPMLRVPEVYINKYGPLSGTSMLVMRDESSTLTTGKEEIGASWQQCCSAAVRYATFHALHWSASLNELNTKFALDWLGTFDWMNNHPVVARDVIMFPAFEEVILDDYLREVTPLRVQRGVVRMMNNLHAVFKHLKQTRPFTVIHADARVENMMFPAPGNLKMDYVVGPNPEIDLTYDKEARWLALDWQTMTKSIGVFDLAYLVSLDLTCESGCDDTPDRKLVELYHNTLVENGVRGYSLEQCWLDYRLSVLIASLIPFVVMSPKNIGEDGFERARKTRRQMLQRSCAAILRVGAITAMDELIDQLVSFADSIPPPPAPRQLTSYFNETSFVEQAPPTAQDDSFSHHTKESLASLPTGSRVTPGIGARDAYDRWFINGYSPDGSVYFAIACGFYPGRKVIDAGISIIHNGLQRNIKSSRYSVDEDFASTDTTVGPIRVAVVDPLRSGLVQVDYPERGIKVDLRFKERFPACKEPKFDNLLKNMVFNYERLTQLIEWEGTIEIRGTKFEVNNWFGTRDRSWGLRPHPAADRSPATAKFLANFMKTSIGQAVAGLTGIQFYWLWVPLNLTKFGIASHSQENAEGIKTNSSIKLFCPEEKKQLAAVEADFKYIAGTRHIKSGVLKFQTKNNERLEVTLEPLFPFYMHGIGYNAVDMPHGSVPQGIRPGEAKTIYSVLCTELMSRTDPANIHIQELCRLSAKWDNGNTDVGMGIIEQMIVGPHMPSCFQGFAGT